MKDNSHDEREAFEELRRLLLGPELEKIENLHQQVEVPENFSTQVSDILPQAMIKSAQNSDALSEAMIPTVEEIVKLSIKRDINKFADALFPVIGPAIRKSIRETIRQMMQSLNRTLEQGLSWKGVKWRIESMRTGIPFAQIAMLHGLVYRVEQVFLIHRRTGLLLCHLGQDDVQAQDPDLVSSMLSAINDFVGDSFEVEAERSLNSIEVGDISIWLEVAPDAILAIAIRGEAPTRLRTVQQQTLERVQAELGESLAAFENDPAPFEERREILRDCLQAQYQQAAKKGLSGKTILFLLLLISGLAYWMYVEWQQASLRWQYVDAIRAEPGYVVIDADREDSVLVVSGLRDPLARPPSELLSASALEAEQVSHRFRPYQSLEAEFVELRARRLLDPPPGVTLEFEGNRAMVSGVADPGWRDQLAARVSAITGIDGFDDSALRTRFSPRLLKPPPGVEMQLEQGVLYVEGAAQQEWIDTLSAVAATYPEVDAVDLRALVNQTEVALIREIGEFEREQIFFKAATSYDFDSIDASRLGEKAKKIIALADKLSRNVLIIVRGYSDSVGSFDDNVFLSRERADFVAQALFNTGINPRYFSIRGMEAPVKPESNEAERRYNRRVEIEVVIE